MIGMGLKAVAICGPAGAGLRLRRAARGVAGFALCLLGFCAVVQAQPQPAAATNLINSFRIKAGFRIELVAAEPMVVAPAAMAFDENGRLLVAELRDYPDGQNLSPHPGRIRLLDSSRQDGTYDVSTVYAENLAWPSALACWDGGIFVATTPDIVYVKAPQQEGNPEIRKTVASGFGAGAPFRQEAVLNSFAWGLDNRIYAATANLGGLAFSPAAPANAPVTMNGCDLAFNPQTYLLEPVAGPSQSGLSVDNQGRRFGCSAGRPLTQALWEPQYRLRNPFFAKPAALWDAADPATVIYRFNPAATNLPARASNRSATALAQTIPLVPGWLTNAKGCVVYRGGAFPAGYMQNVFIPDPADHLIHRVVLSQNGLTTVAERAPDEAVGEFLLSRDPAFQPVQVVNGPEGGLYIADFHGGGGQGRIYRILPAGFKPPKPVRLGAATTRELIQALAHADGWRSDSAARLLCQRRDPAAAALLETACQNAGEPLVRLRALHVLATLGGLSENALLFALQDSDPRVREHAVRLSEPLLRNNEFAPVFWNQLEGLAGDPSPQVRYQLALSLGESRRPERVRALARLVQTDPADLRLRAAVLSSLSDGAGNLFAALARNAAFRGIPAGEGFLRQLAQMMGVKGRLDEVTQGLDFLNANDSDLGPRLTLTLLYDLGDGLNRTRSSLMLVDPQYRLNRFFDGAANGLFNDDADPSLRLAAINLLQYSNFIVTNVEDMCLLLLGSGQTEAVQTAAIRALAQIDTPRTATNLLARWPVLSPALRQEAVARLLEREQRVSLILARLEAGAIRTSEVPMAQVNLLRFHPTPSVRERALGLFGPLELQRPEAMAQFQSAIQTGGNAAHGRQLFSARCAGCHQPASDGKALGPALMGARTRGREKLLAAIVEPNALPRPDYQTCVLETQSGEDYIGILDDENPTTVALRRPGALPTVWPRSNQYGLRAQSWSLMPDDLTRDYSVQDMADLLDYLMTGTE